MIVFPSILEKTAEAYVSQIQKLSKYYSHFQIDIADGIFVSNKTAQIEEIQQKISNFKFQISNCSFEFHLMVQDYKKEIEKLEKLRNYINIKTILIHFSLHPLFSILSTQYPEFFFGFVLNPEDSVKTIKTEYNLQKVPVIQIMSINPGAQGNPFIPESLQKVEQLRNANYKNIISLDGGINGSTIPYICSREFQPDIICPGSFLTRAENLEERVEYLRKVAF